MAKLFQIQAFTQPLVPIAPPPETVTVDKWQGRPQHAPSRPRLITALVPSLAFVAVVTIPTPVYAGAQNCEPIAKKRYQYQVKAEPVLVPTPVVVTPVYAGNQNCEPISIKHFQYQAKAEPVTVPTVTPPTPVYCGAQNCEPIAKRRYQYQIKAEPVLVPAAAAPTTPVYVGAQNCEPISIKHFQYQSHFKPLVPIAGAPPETITVDKWAQPAQLPIRRPKRLVVLGVNTAVAEEVIYSDVLFQPINVPTFKQRRTAELGKTFSTRFEPPAAEGAITLDKWGQPTSRPPAGVKRNQYLYPTLGRPISTIFVETSSVDKWIQPTQQPRFDLKRIQYSYQVVASDYLAQVPGAEIIRLDKWGQPTNRPPRGVTRLQYLYPTIFRPTGIVFVERAQQDKWQQPQSLPRRDRKRWQHLYPPLAIDAAFHLVPSGIVDYPAYDRDFGIIVLRTSETSGLVLMPSESGSTELTSNETGVIAIIYQETGVLD